MAKNQLILDGQKLSVLDIDSFVRDQKTKVEIAGKPKNKILASYKFLTDTLKQKADTVIYGINTGFGPMASHVLAPEQLLNLQKNLIYSHAVGMGERINPDFVLASMVVRLNTLVKGYSGVSLELLNFLKNLINKRIIPVVPRHGAVGTSGDLVQLAHIALVILGDGKVIYESKEYQTKDLYKKLAIQPYVLKPKEGLSLINGTSVMAGVGSLAFSEAERLFSFAVSLGALSLELVNAYSDSISPMLHILRPHPGQLYVAYKLRKLLSASQLLKSRNLKTHKVKTGREVEEMPEAIQEVYSLRCLAQILGPIYETLNKTRETLEIEINSVTDNPIVDAEHKNFLHGGNFHGDYIASAMDFLKISIAKLTMLSERRINYFLNQKINKHFPPFMNLKTPGLTLGLQGLQFVATSTTAHNQSLAFPHHIHSISTNGDNQDVVSMGTDAALIAAEVIDNASTVLAIEALTLCQGVDFLGSHEKLSPNSKRLYSQIRSVVPKIVEDRVLFEELNLLKTKIQLELL